MPSSPIRVAAPVGGAVVLLLGAALWLQSRLGASLLPHSFCITASRPLQWLHVAGDMLIALAYLLIPLSLLHFVRRRRDIPFGWLGLLFGGFIVSCGITHAMEVWTLWEPVYWYSGVMKALTAAVSLATAWVLIQLMPLALALPSAAQLRSANEALQREVDSRRQVEILLREAQAELERSVARSTAQAEQASTTLNRFFDMAPLGLAMFDEQLRLVRINEALARAQGMHAAGHEGRPLAEVLPDVGPAFVETVQSVVNSRQPRRDVEVGARDAAGQPRQWLLNCFPIELPGRPLRVGATVQDISYQRAIEGERVDALAAAEEANRLKDQFLARVSHELRSPLQVAMSSTEVLKRLGGLPETAQRVVQRLAHSVRQQARMVSDLLDVSRILSGKLHLELRLIDPAAPLLQALDHWQEVAQPRGVRIDVGSVRPGLGLVEVDPARLEQIYTNLLDNAIRFSDEGGSVELDIRVTPEGPWRLEVRDHGAGLASRELRSIFEPFVQGQGQPARGKGLGLGLSIVRHLAEAFGGRVWANSEGPGRGSQFFVELPLAGAQARARAQARAGEQAPGVPRLDGVRILYVEDEQDVGESMRDGLAAAGAQVEVAASHAQALEHLRQASFDVLVTDLNLGPGPSGVDLLQALRALPGTAGLPAVAVSAFGGEEHRRAAGRAGFAAHLVKPVEADAVAQAVLRVLALPPLPGGPEPV